MPQPRRSRPRALQPAKVAAILDQLEDEYGKARFISRFDPLDELVSCILSQNTADANSFPAFTRLRTDFPTWDEVVKAGPEGIIDSIRKAGLSTQKSKAIIGSLQRIRDCFGSYTLEPLRQMDLLKAREWLEQLPGVGPKTASIVLCFSFGRPAIPVDTHVHRVGQRLGFIPDGMDEKKSHDHLLGAVSPTDAYRFHSLLIQHGRHVCRAPLPECQICVVQSGCPWFKKVGPEKLKRRLAAARKSK